LDPDPAFAESVLKPGGCRLTFLIKTENLRTVKALLSTRIQKYRFYYRSYTVNTRDLDPDPDSGILLNPNPDPGFAENRFSEAHDPDSDFSNKNMREKNYVETNLCSSKKDVQTPSSSWN
jgi:hypothetical protein